MKFSKKKMGGRRISNYNTTILSDNRNYNSSNKNRSINNRIKKYKYSTHIKNNTHTTTTKQTKIGFYDKETEKRMNVKDYPGPCPYYDDVVNEDNYIYQSGKLVKKNKPLQFKYRPPGPDPTQMNYKSNNSKRSNFNRKNNNRSKNNKSKKNSQNNHFQERLNNNTYDNNNQLTGGGIHWDNLNPQRIYLNDGPSALIDFVNRRQRIINVNGCTAQVYTNANGFGFNHADMVCFPGCGRDQGDTAAQGTSDDYRWNERFFTMLACGGFINKVEGLEGGGAPEKYNLLFMERPRGRCYTMSHFISRQAWTRRHSWIPPEGSDRSWNFTYVRWMLRSCISLMVTAYSNEEWSIRDVGENTYFRYIFDYNNALMLASPELQAVWGDPQDPDPRNNPWAYMCYRDINEGGIDDFPITNPGDAACRDTILEVWHEFLSTYTQFSNYLDQYLYLWWLAGRCMGFFDFGADTPKYSRVELLLYRYPWASTDDSANLSGAPLQHEPMGMGQLTRYLTLIQKPYVNSIPASGQDTPVNMNPSYPMGIRTPELAALDGSGTVFPPLVTHLRDGHSSATSNQSIRFDAAWENGTFRYLIATNPTYCQQWHERRAGWLAGVFSAKKDANNQTLMTIDTWKETFGRGLAWHQNGDNPYLTICPSRSWGNGVGRDGAAGRERNQQGQWGYGLEEFLGSWMLMDVNGRTGWQNLGAGDMVRKLFCNTLWLGSITWFQHFIDYNMNTYHNYKVWEYNRNFAWNVHNQKQRLNVGDSECVYNPSYVQVFYRQYKCLCKLALEFCYWYITWKEFKAGVTWKEVRDKLNEIKIGFTCGIGNAAKLQAFRTNINGHDNHLLDEEFVRFLVLIVPPIYAFLTTLFSNGSSHDFIEQLFPSQYHSLEQVINDIIRLRENSMNYTEDANIIYNIQRMNSIYQLQSQPEPPIHGVGMEIQKDYQNGFDFREWYAPEKEIRIVWQTHNPHGQHKPNWYFYCRRAGGEDHVDLWADLTSDRNGPRGNGCANSWFLFPVIGPQL